jgi:hypothetical protein
MRAAMPRSPSKQAILLLCSGDRWRSSCSFCSRARSGYGRRNTESLYSSRSHFRSCESLFNTWLIIIARMVLGPSLYFRRFCLSACRGVEQAYMYICMYIRTEDYGPASENPSGKSRDAQRSVSDTVLGPSKPRSLMFETHQSFSNAKPQNSGNVAVSACIRMRERVIT